MKRRLTIIAGPDTGRSFAIADGQSLIVGRGQSSDTQISDPHLSRVHCHVQADGDRTWLIDAGSAGGSAVNGQPVSKAALKPGDVIFIGGTQLRFQLEGDLEESTVIGQAFGRPVPQPAVAPLQSLVGQSLAHYRVDSVIAAGISGMVFRATDVNLGRPAAIKVLQPDFAHQDEQRERFVRAMKTMLPILHKNIVTIYNAGKSGPYCWAAMEYVDGENLLQVIHRIGIDGMLDWREVWRVAVDIGLALLKAHKIKVVHRNVTPTNILRQRADRVCLLGDLMLAKALDGTLARQVTQPGQLIGDIAYMSPERTRDGAVVDGRSDLYGLGSTLYALLTGHPPFQSKLLPELVSKIRNEAPQPPKLFQLSVQDQLQDVVLKLLSKRPEDRHASPLELLRDLERIGRYNRLDLSWTEEVR